MTASCLPRSSRALRGDRDHSAKAGRGHLVVEDAASDRGERATRRDRGCRVQARHSGRSSCVTPRTRATSTSIVRPSSGRVRAALREGEIRPGTALLGAIAVSAFTRVFDALWRIAPPFCSRKSADYVEPVIGRRFAVRRSGLGVSVWFQLAGATSRRSGCPHLRL